MRRITVSGCLGLVAAAALALGAQSAAAAAIHACVKPKSGATRIVSAKANCRHGEQKLSWNTTGERGPAGANGANGTNGSEGKAGANGAGTVYSTFEENSEPAPLATGLNTILTKVIPPGTYKVSAKTTVVGKSTTAAHVKLICYLVDLPGTAKSSEGTTIDITALTEPLVEIEPGEWLLDAPLTLEGTVTSTVTSTLSMICVKFEATETSAAVSRIEALTVTYLL